MALFVRLGSSLLYYSSGGHRSVCASNYFVVLSLTVCRKGELFKFIPIQFLLVIDARAGK